MKDLFILIQKDINLELKRRHMIGSVLIYLLAIIYIINFLFQQISMQSWNVLYWIIVLFASIQVCLKGYISESRDSRLMYYQLGSAEVFYLSKVIYNTLLILLLELICLGGFHIISPIRLGNYGLFIGLLILVALGFSAIMSFTSIFVSQAPTKSTIISILSIPLLFPILLEGVKITATLLGFVEIMDRTQDFTIILAIDVLILSVGLILFPYLWRE